VPSVSLAKVKEQNEALGEKMTEEEQKAQMAKNKVQKTKNNIL
jgi:hypothetical protein